MSLSLLLACLLARVFASHIHLVVGKRACARTWAHVASVASRLCLLARLSFILTMNVVVVVVFVSFFLLIFVYINLISSKQLLQCSNLFGIYICVCKNLYAGITSFMIFSLLFSAYVRSWSLATWLEVK